MVQQWSTKEHVNVKSQPGLPLNVTGPLGCHFRLAAAEGAQIGLPEFDIGTVPASGGSARLSKCVGRDRALDMILRANKISGPEAHRIGLVHEVWPLAELKEQAVKLAHELAAQPALSVRGMLDVIVGSEDKTLQELIEAERVAVNRCRDSADSQEGSAAFLEKKETGVQSGRLTKHVASVHR